MKALSLIQPWASLLFPFAGRPAMKLHETRSWATKHRGTIAIHASSAKHRRDGYSYTAITTQMSNLMWPSGSAAWITALPKYDQLPRGCIIGIVELQDCQPTEDLKPDQLDELCGNFAPGRYAWRMAKPVLFAKPIPCRGSLGLWEVPPAIMFDIEMQYLKS